MLPRPEPLGTSAEVAEYVGVPETTITAWRYKGVGPAYIRVGKYVRYHWSDVNAWLAERTVRGGAA